MDEIAVFLIRGVLNREISKSLGDNRVEPWAQIAEDAFGNALGNAAIAGIEHENQVAAQKQLRESVDQLQATQSAELGASTDAFETQTGEDAMADIRAQGQATLDQEYTGTEQALEGRLASMPDPSLAASIAAMNGNLPQGSVTVEPLQIIEEGGRYGNAAQQREPILAKRRSRSTWGRHSCRCPTSTCRWHRSALFPTRRSRVIRSRRFSAPATRPRLVPS